MDFGAGSGTRNRKALYAGLGLAAILVILGAVYFSGVRIQSSGITTCPCLSSAQMKTIMNDPQTNPPPKYITNYTTDQNSSKYSALFSNFTGKVSGIWEVTYNVADPIEALELVVQTNDAPGLYSLLLKKESEIYPGSAFTTGAEVDGFTYSYLNTTSFPDFRIVIGYKGGYVVALGYGTLNKTVGTAQIASMIGSTV
jgi:hypothetical protein